MLRAYSKNIEVSAGNAIPFNTDKFDVGNNVGHTSGASAIILRRAGFYEVNLDIAFTSPGWIDEKNLKKMKMVVPSCGACLSNMSIAPNGDIIPCQSWLNGTSLGNILKDEFKEVWNGEMCKKIRKKASLEEQICLLKEGVFNGN